LAGKVGIVFQYPETQLFEQTVYDDIAFGPKNIHLNNIEERVKQAIEFVDISEKLLKNSPFEISGGEQRKVAIAGVIAMEPEILVLDEPTVGLDPATKKSILNKIKKYHETKQNTIIMVTHDIDIAAEFASKILMLDNGKIVKYGSVEEVFSDIDTAIPEMTKIFRELKKIGFDVNTNIYTVKQAKQEILTCLNQNGK